ncbi:DUF4253 domain-containing protein [Paenarthrobacter nicotinovorans]|uniref:DUF4253 domain-containing protein n=1 Tax=Paenarthrobacter nicotinovorans TaxID=29320 RepID=A0ABV0GQV9_PAENI|nr:MULTISPECIES: DUF4253 domain-containing protein [Micrococcaceae]BCW56733.1 hypothetical protein StoSoilB20_00800 [Arthrobacter sp. StoSoilB20]
MTTVDEIQKILTGHGFPSPLQAVTPAGVPALVWDPELAGEASWQVQRELTGKLPGWHVFTYGAEPSDPEELAEAWEEQGPAEVPAYSVSVGNLVAVQVENPGDVVHALEWEGADNLGTRTELAALLRRWNRLAGAVPVHLSDTDNATLVLAVPDLPKIQDELEQACDEIAIISTNPGRTALIELWWD